MDKKLILVLLVSCTTLPFFAQSYAAINDSSFNTVYIVNGQLIATPFLLDVDKVQHLQTVTDTLITVNNKVFKNCIFISYSSSLELIPLRKLKGEVENDYKDFSHIYMINNEFIHKSAPHFLIDKDYIWKTELITLLPSHNNCMNEKILVIRIFTKRAQKEMEGQFNIR